MPSNPIKKISGFTLAEVLITLGIIGVIAAITIPIIMNVFQDAQFMNAYKKAYSVLSQAFIQTLNNNEFVAFTGTNSSQGAEANFAAIKQKFLVSKNCDVSHFSDCWNTNGETFRTETPTVSFIDNSGMAWRLRALDSSTTTPAILVDTNGNKSPNQYGKDRFPFLFSNGGVVTIIPDNVFHSYSDDMMSGIPVKIIPMADVTINSTNNLLVCPSLAVHFCHYTSWLYN